jgi:hypothetical protein
MEERRRAVIIYVQWQGTGPIRRREDMSCEQIGAVKIIAELGSDGMGTVYRGQHAIP